MLLPGCARTRTVTKTEYIKPDPRVYEEINAKEFSGTTNSDLLEWALELWDLIAEDSEKKREAKRLQDESIN